MGAVGLDEDEVNKILGDVACESAFVENEERVDISKKWPSWLKAAAVCKDESGYWWMYELIPTRSDTQWIRGDCSSVALGMIDVVLPSEWDWEKPIINPNWKK